MSEYPIQTPIPTTQFASSQMCKDVAKCIVENLDKKMPRVVFRFCDIDRKSRLDYLSRCFSKEYWQAFDVDICEELAHILDVYQLNENPKTEFREISVLWNYLEKNKKGKTEIKVFEVNFLKVPRKP